ATALFRIRHSAGLADPACATGERRTKRGQDAGGPNSRAIWPTEDAAPRSVRRRQACAGDPSSPPEGRALGDHLPGLRQFLGAADAEAAGDAVALQVPDRELAALAVTAPLLPVPLVGGADVLEAGPVGEIAEEVGDDFVIRVVAEQVAG